MAVHMRQHVDDSSGAIVAHVPKLANNAKIAHTLFTAIVKDKQSYPLRELGKNAWEVSPEGKPWRLELPTQWSPVIKFRDFGPGLSQTFMLQRFARLGDSTKDADGVSGISGWGYGSKSPFAYLMEEGHSGSYNVISYQRGTAKHYVISLTVQGMPQVKLFLVHETDEPDGLEVSFAVRVEDVESFHERAREVLWSFNPRPVIVPALEMSEPEVRAQGNGWTLYAGHSVPFDGPQVRVGPILYPIDAGQVPLPGKFLKWQDCIVFDLDPMVATPTASREELQYTAAMKKALMEMFSAYDADFVRSFQEKVEAAPTYFEACQVVEREAYRVKDRIGHLREAITWREIALREKVVSPKTMPLNRGWDRFEKFTNESVDCSWCHDAKVVVEFSGYRSLDRFFALDLVGEKILWVRVPKAELPHFLALHGLAEDDVVILNKAPIEHHTRQKGVPRPATVRRRRVFTFREVEKDDGQGSLTTTYLGTEETEDVDLAAGGWRMRLGPSSTYRRRKDGYHLSDTGWFVIENTRFKEFLVQLRMRGALQEDLKVLVDTGIDDLNDDWKPVGPFLEGLIRDQLDMGNVTPIDNDTTLRQFPSDLMFSDFWDLSTAPADVVDFQARAKAVHDQLSAKTAPDPTPDDALFDLLKKVASVERPEKPRAACPVAPLKREREALLEKYPLILTIQRELGNHGYYDEKNRTRCKNNLKHYFELLKK